MIDVVIPYNYAKPGAELLFTLRSLEKHVSGIGNVILVGFPHTFVTNVRWFQFSEGDRMGGKEKNIFEKIEYACNRPVVSDPFLLVHDDHFILEDYEAAEFPYYFHGYVEGHRQEMKEGNPYERTLKNTVEATGRWAKDYDCHCPMLVDKKKFLRELTQVDWRKPYGFAIKSLYCWANKIEGVYIEDCKIRKPTIEWEILDTIQDRPWFSTDDKAMNGDMLKVLRELYPNKSKWER